MRRTTVMCAIAGAVAAKRAAFDPNEAEGHELVRTLNGQWAFAIWDDIRRTLLLSRDRFGVRPLFYTTRRDRLLFASEIKALFVDPSVTREIDPRGLDNVLTFWTTLPPRTVFKDVHELPAGHSLMWHDGLQPAQ